MARLHPKQDLAGAHWPLYDLIVARFVLAQRVSSMISSHIAMHAMLVVSSCMSLNDKNPEMLWRATAAPSVWVEKLLSEPFPGMEDIRYGLGPLRRRTRPNVKLMANEQQETTQEDASIRRVLPLMMCQKGSQQQQLDINASAILAVVLSIMLYCPCSASKATKVRPADEMVLGREHYRLRHKQTKSRNRVETKTLLEHYDFHSPGQEHGLQRFS